MKYFLLILLFLSLSACNVENVPNNNDAPTPTPDATVTENPTIFEFPNGTVILKELLPNEVDKIEIEHTDMSGSYVISVESEEKIQTIINLLSNVEISDEYEPIFGVNSEGFEIRLFDGVTLQDGLEDENGNPILAKEILAQIKGNTNAAYILSEDGLLYFYDEDLSVVGSWEQKENEYTLMLDDGEMIEVSK